MVYRASNNWVYITTTRYPLRIEDGSETSTNFFRWLSDKKHLHVLYEGFPIATLNYRRVYPINVWFNPLPSSIQITQTWPESRSYAECHPKGTQGIVQTQLFPGLSSVQSQNGAQ